MRNDYLKLTTVQELKQLSMEEAAILVGEMGETIEHIDSCFDQIATAQQVSAGLSDMNEITTLCPEANGDVLKSIADASAAVVLDVEETDMEPIMESFAENMKSIYEKIVALLKKMWAHFQNFFKKIFDYRNYLKQRIKALRQELAKREDKQTTHSPTIKLSVRESLIFAVEGKELISVESYKKVMEEIYTNVKGNFERAPVAIEALGSAFIQCVESFKPDDAQGSVQHAFVGVIQPALWRYFDSFKIGNFKKKTLKAEHDHTATASSPPLAGRCKIQLEWGEAMNEFFIDRHTTKPIAEVVNGLVSTKVQIISDGSVQHASSEVITPAFSFKGLDNALMMVERGLTAMDALESSQKSKMQDMSDRFGRAVQLKMGEVVKFTEEQGEHAPTPASMEAKKTFEALTRLPTVYATLAVHPIDDIAHRTVGTFAVVLNMVEKSLMMYGTKGAPAAAPAAPAAVPA